MTGTAQLFTPVRMGGIDLPNRILMAPLTRNRAQSDGTPADMAQTYYAQRASAGLIVSEATQVAAMGKGYLDTPGIHEPAHVEGWRKVTDAVHAAGGRIFLQLWHVGRISHVSLLPEGRNPVAPSAVRAETQTYTADGFADCSEPDALDADGIAEVVAQFRHGAELAKEAGFDGVEVHAANGYLIDQFLQDKTNRRDDAYGGSIENRMRLLGEVIDAVATVWPRERIGVRVSPMGQANDIADSNSEELFSEIYSYLSEQRLAYLHVVEQFPGSENGEDEAALLQRLRARYDGFVIGNGGYDAETASEAVSEERCDAVAFGRPFIANPDLPERYRTGAELNEPDPDTFYGGGAEGYIDYPFAEDAKVA